MKNEKTAAKKTVTKTTPKGVAKAPAGSRVKSASTDKAEPAAKPRPRPPAPGQAVTVAPPPIAEAPETAGAAPKVRKSRAPRKPAPPPIPPILLEGDEPVTSPVGGPGRRYALGPGAPPEHDLGGEPGELPEAYGTRRVLLAARDPHWLYAHWDFTRDQQKGYNAHSSDGHLVLRVYVNEVKGRPHAEVHVHPESRSWFVHVGKGGTRYVAELGYYRPDTHWTTVSVSLPTVTPPDTISDDATVRFETIPLDISFDSLVQLVKAVLSENVPLLEAIQQLRAMGYARLPDAPTMAAGQWTVEQEQALAQAISMDEVRRVWLGSLEITELLRRKLAAQISSAGLPLAGQPLPPGAVSSISSISSPYGGRERHKGFWFNVNAELIIYGATEPDAVVTIAGRQIRLRPDGSFSYRFALPDGQYDLPAVAVSADGTDGRCANLRFSRATEYRGDVGTHPQDPSLAPPLPENVA